jgi:hypothetical protein
MGFIAAMLVKPAFPVQKRLTPQDELPEGKVVKNAKTDHVLASLYQLTDSGYQIVLTLEQPLKSPVTTLYATVNNPDTQEGSQFIGKVDGIGTYLFPVHSDTFTVLLLYDAVHQKIVQTLSF